MFKGKQFFVQEQAFVYNNLLYSPNFIKKCISKKIIFCSQKRKCSKKTSSSLMNEKTFISRNFKDSRKRKCSKLTSSSFTHGKTIIYSKTRKFIKKLWFLYFYWFFGEPQNVLNFPMRIFYKWTCFKNIFF